MNQEGIKTKCELQRAILSSVISPKPGRKLMINFIINHMIKYSEL